MSEFNKKTARKKFLNDRLILTTEELDWASQKIHDLLFSRIMMHRFSPIHIFLPLTSKNEINTWKIIETLQKDFSPEIYISQSLDNGELLHTELTKNTVLNTNKWGIEEPAGSETAISSELFFKKFSQEDILVLIPLLIFDKSGQRVGYGKGYYDRFLAYSGGNCTKIGLSVFEPIAQLTDAASTDIRMDFCITPERVWSWK